jgi:topoisomerase-4 subunit B
LLFPPGTEFQSDGREGTADSVERPMGTKAEARFAFISDKA